MNGMTFRVGTADYVVVETPHLTTKHALLGQVTYDDAQIAIEPTMCNQRKANVIVHELVHAMLFEAGYDEHDEDQVRRFSNVLTQVLRDNLVELSELFNEEESE
jgi:hypothetical protein